MGIHRLIIGRLVAGVLGIFSSSALADSDDINPMLDKTYGIWIGGFFPELNTTVSINGEVIENNPNLSLEDVFGLDDAKSVLWGGANWKISKRNLLEIEFANLNRNGTSIIEAEINIDDTIANVGAMSDTKFDLFIARLTYGYGLVKNKKMDLQLKVGFHLTDIQLGIQLSGDIEVCQPGEIPPNCDAIGGETESLETSDITFPLPHLGASFAYALSPNFVLRAQAIGFAIEMNGIKGSLLEIDADLVYHPWRRVGFGAGVRYFNANVESSGDRLDGEFDFEYFGPTVYGIITF